MARLHETFFDEYTQFRPRAAHSGVVHKTDELTMPRGEYNIQKKFDCLNCNQSFWNPKTPKKFHRSLLSFASSLLEFYVESQRLRLIDKGCEALCSWHRSSDLVINFFLCLRDSSPKAFPWRDIIWINQWVEHIYAHACAMTLSKRDNERNGEWKKAPTSDRKNFVASKHTRSPEPMSDLEERCPNE